MNIKVKGHKDWERDEKGMLVNSNLTEFKNFKRREAVMQAKDDENRAQRNHINNIEDKLERLETMMKHFLENRTA